MHQCLLATLQCRFSRHSNAFLTGMEHANDISNHIFLVNTSVMKWSTLLEATTQITYQDNRSSWALSLDQYVLGSYLDGVSWFNLVLASRCISWFQFSKENSQHAGLHLSVTNQFSQTTLDCIPVRFMTRESPNPMHRVDKQLTTFLD